MAGALLGVHVRVATPKGYEPDADIVSVARSSAAASGGSVELFTSPEEAVAGSQAVYTDVWASMGQEGEAGEREKIFAPYRVDTLLMKAAAPGALFLHCLPAHRGAEVTDAVMDSPHSTVFDQAENRLHIQKAILFKLLVK
jgi:ornithine carbamoyltransferase